MTTIPDLNELSATPADDDLFLVHDVSAASNNDKKVTRTNLLGGVAMDGGDHDFGTSEIADLTTQNATLGFTDGATLAKIIKASGTVTPSDITTGASETVTLTLTGALTTDHLVWNIAGALPNGLTAQAWVSAADTVSLKLHNTTGSTITGASYTLRAAVLRFS